MGLPSIGSWDRPDSRKRSCFRVVSGNHRYCTRGANPGRGRELRSEAPNRLKLWIVIPSPCRRSPRRRGREVSKASVVAGRIETMCRRVRRRARDTLHREGFLPKYTACANRAKKREATTREARLESDGLGPALSARRGISLDRASSRRAGRDSFPRERSVGLARGPGPISSPVSRGVRDAPFGGARDTRSRKRPSGISLSWGRRANLAP
jgi:hypothetical protein